jgi:hypothetical protein
MCFPMASEHMQFTAQIDGTHHGALSSSLPTLT